MRKTLQAFVLAFLVAAWASQVPAAVSVDGLLESQVAADPLRLTPVVITFDHAPTAADLASLKTLGIPGGVVVSELPMVLTAVNQAQLAALKTKPGILSLYANRTLQLFTNVSRSFIGVKALWKDPQVTTANGGMPVSGQGIGVAYVDTGIDATHPDLQLGKNVLQNVLFPLAEVPLNFLSDFVPQVAVENVPHSDVEGGHGTFGAAVLAGTGAASGAYYGGAAPGAKLVGLVAGNDAGLSTFAILQAFGYALANQFRYNIRVCNNSWGTTLADTPYDPFDPINVATRTMHDRNITVVFAAGNAGDTPGAINPYSVAPWVISVAAGEKEGFGTPASFSSRGQDNGTGTDTPGQPADPLAPPNLRPDITGSGVDIKSARAKAPGVTNLAGTIPLFVGANDLNTIPPAFLPFYTTSQGTSFASPQVAGVVALMLEANPTLTPDDVVRILRETATPMPFEERVVGAGYVDAHNAVRAAMALAPLPHPANLYPGPDTPEILDPAGDQLGTRAQDIRAADFAYDAPSGQLVYTLTLEDLSNPTPNSRWTLSSTFGSTTVFVTAAISETGTRSFTYGRITTLPTGTRNQQTLGPADAGQFDGNRIVIRLGVEKVSAAAGFEVLHTLSTAPEAISQILIGTSFTGGLLLTSDRATGRDFFVGKPIPPPDPGPNPEPGPQAFNERFAGVLPPGEEAAVAFDVKKPHLAAKLTAHPGHPEITFDLLDAQGTVLATADQPEMRLVVGNLPPGAYRFRVRGTASDPVDFVIHTHQSENPE